MPKQWQPAEGRVIVKRDEVPNEIPVESDLVSPHTGRAVRAYQPDISVETEQRFNEYATVWAVGDPLILDDGSERFCPADPGDRVFIQPNAGRQITIGGMTLDILPFAAILAVEREIEPRKVTIPIVDEVQYD